MPTPDTTSSITAVSWSTSNVHDTSNEPTWIQVNRGRTWVAGSPATCRNTSTLSTKDNAAAVTEIQAARSRRLRVASSTAAKPSNGITGISHATPIAPVVVRTTSLTAASP